MKEHYAEFTTGKGTYMIKVNGETLASSNKALLLHEYHKGKKYDPVVYFPNDSINWSQLQNTKTSTYCPLKGDASYYSYHTKDQTIDDILWTYEGPFEEVKEIKQHSSFYNKEGITLIIEGE